MQSSNSPSLRRSGFALRMILCSAAITACALFLMLAGVDSASAFSFHGFGRGGSGYGNQRGYGRSYGGGRGYGQRGGGCGFGRCGGSRSGGGDGYGRASGGSRWSLDLWFSPHRREVRRRLSGPMQERNCGGRCVASVGAA